MRNFACDLDAKMVQHMPAKWRHYAATHRPLALCRLVSLASPSLSCRFLWHMFPCGTPWNFTRLFAKITKCAGFPPSSVCIFTALTLWLFPFQLFSLSSSCLPLFFFCTVCLSKCLLSCHAFPLTCYACESLWHTRTHTHTL